MIHYIKINKPNILTGNCFDSSHKTLSSAINRVKWLNWVDRQFPQLQKRDIQIITFYK
jgi:hypothetical protein